MIFGAGGRLWAAMPTLTPRIQALLARASKSKPPRAADFKKFQPVMDVLKGRGFTKRDGIEWLVNQGAVPGSAKRLAASVLK